MNQPTGKTHKLVTLSDLLKLSRAEFARLLPDLVAWHRVCLDVAEFVGQAPGSMGEILEWTDDGLKQVNGVCLDLGEHGVVDLLKPETWPKDQDETKTEKNADAPQSQ